MSSNSPEASPAAAGGEQPRPSANPLRYPSFRILWGTTGLVAGGVWFQQVTLGWLAYDLTRSPLHVAGVVGIRALPLLLSPITGVIADRVDRKRLLMVDQALVTLLVFLFSVILFLNLVQIAHLYVFAVLFGVLWAANNPVRQVLVANTVPREALMQAVAMSSMAFNAMRALGPAIGGFVIAYLGPDINFLIQGVLFLIALLLISRLRTPYYTAEREARARSPLGNLAEGFRHVIHDPVTRIIAAMSFGLSFTTMAVVFNQLPVYSAEALNNDDGVYLGLLLMAMGVGGLLGGGVIAVFALTRKKGLVASAAFAASALCVVILSQNTLLWVAMVLLVLQQMFGQIVMTTHMTTIHTVTPDSLRGRVMGVYQMEIGMMPFGGFIAGAIASAHGVGNAFLAAGVAGIVIIAIASVAFPRYRRLQF